MVERQRHRGPFLRRSRAPLPVRLALAALAAAAAWAAPASGAGGEAAPGPSGPLPERYAAWLAEVEPLLLEAERAAFLALTRDYRRDRFIERFWQVRDPHPETGRNEFRDEWEARRDLAEERFGGPATDRGRVLLLAGPPHRVSATLCPEKLRSAEVWIYAGERNRRQSSVVFVVGPGPSPDGYNLWEPGLGPASLLRSFDPQAGTDRMTYGYLAAECFRGAETIATLEAALGWREVRERLTSLPVPDGEWVEAFAERSTDLAPDAETLAAMLELDFPGRRQSRTVLQGLITVPRRAAAVGTTGERQSFNFLVDGEVLLDGRLFETFRYRFDLPVEIAGDPLPLTVERYLRPNDYTLIVKVEDLNSQRSFRAERRIHVPAVSRSAGSVGDVSPAERPFLAAALEEANASLAYEHTLKILPPPERLHTDRLRIQAATTGEGIAKVTFLLNERPVMSKTRPPFSVELDLGQAPRLHVVEAVAYDDAGYEVARDKIPVNAGPHRFDVRLIEPQPGGFYGASLRAHAEVKVPHGETLQRLEFYLNENLLATLFQPPFVLPILLPEDGRVTFVRAVAYLDGGISTEDLVFVNAPDNLDRLNVNFVELYTSVLDRKGRPVDGLTAADFRVWEEGAEQTISRFERARDLPMRAGILLDTSTSMVEELGEAIEAALRFFESVVESKDRAAVITFSDRPELKVPFTNKIEVLSGGLAGLTAEGETALLDSLVYALYYFAGIQGKRAVIVLTDGVDSTSRHRVDDTLEFARRSGVALYTIGMDLDQRDRDARNLLVRLARETGGRAFFISRAAELKAIYASIEEELRSQYLIGYQSSDNDSDKFRRVEVAVAQPGLKAKTIPGYHP